MVKHAQKISQQQPTNCFSVFDHFVGLKLNGFIQMSWTNKSYQVSLPKFNLSEHLEHLYQNIHNQHFYSCFSGFHIFLQISAKMFYGKLRSYWFYKVLQNKLFIMIFMGISMNLLWFGINLVDITTIFAWKSWKRDFDRSIYWGKSLSNWLISPQCCILYRNQLIVSLSKMNGWFLFGIQN